MSKILKPSLCGRLATFPDGFRNFRRDTKLSGVPRIQFLTSDWESVTSRKSVVSSSYLIYRFVFFLYFIFCLAWSITIAGPERNYWLLMITNWSFLIQAIYATANFANVYSFSIRESCSGSYVDTHSNVNWFESGIWYLMNLSYSVAPCACIGFWIILYDPARDSNIGLNFAVHGINDILVVLDALIVAAPFNVTHVLYSSSFASFYLLFSYLYDVAGGSYPDETKPYIYPIFNWREDPGSAILTGSYVSGLINVSHFVLWALIQIRSHLASLCRESVSNSVHSSNEDFTYDIDRSDGIQDNERRPLLNK